MIILGIDPGNTGAISVFHDTEYSDVFDMPLCTLGAKGKKKVNADELAHQLAQRAPDGSAVVAYIEHVHAMPGQGVTSMFNFGLGYGIVQGVLGGLGIFTKYVKPQEWKRNYGLIGTEKDAARVLAQGVYTEAPLGRKKDSGRADAILIGAYGAMKELEK